MLPQPLIDTLIVMGMFVLRIGVPFVLTIIVGSWLEKKFQLPEQQEIPRHQVSDKILPFRPRQADFKSRKSTRAGEENITKHSAARK